MTPFPLQTVRSTNEFRRTPGGHLSDLYRNFGIGFGAGAVAILLVNSGEILSAVPQLIAAIL